MLKVFLLVYLIVTVNSDYGRKRRDGKYPAKRFGRLFSFNVVEEDITVELDFSIPFIKIPVKKTADSAFNLMNLSTININPATLALGGAVVVGATVILPFILKHYVIQKVDNPYARLLDDAEFSVEGLLDFTQDMMTSSLRFQGCPLRVVCWAAQNNYADPGTIMQQIMNNKLLSSMVNASSAEDAMISGRQGRACSRYAPCPLEEDKIPVLMKNLALITTKTSFH